jgi:L,D-transpeptidase-like protein
MACYRSRVWAGLKRNASTLSGIGLAALISGTAPDAFAKTGRSGDSGAAVSGPATPAVMAIISLSQQRVTIYDGDGQIMQSPVSTGQTGYETPAGIFSVLERKVEHYSNLYDDASMPFMQRLTWSGIALHAGVLPGRPASHGCIRMPIAFAERVFERTRLGMRVIIVRDDISPTDFRHPALFKPLPNEAGQPTTGNQSTAVDKVSARLAGVSPAALAAPAGPRRGASAIAAAKAEAAARAAAKADEARSAARSATIEAARATRAIRRAEGAQSKAELQLRRAEQIAAGADGAGEAAERAQRARASSKAALEEVQAQLERVRADLQPKVELAQQLRQQAKEAYEASAAAQDEAKEAARKASPITVFISRATQRLYVRQSREQVLEAAVSIADPDKPLGTYIFTALGYADGEADLRWSVVSMYRSAHEARPAPGDKRIEHRHTGAAPADLAGARRALDRIDIPKEASERIAEIAGPGASLIVSDEPASRETGQATDFIVVMSTEPQGGLKIRRRTPALEARNRFQRPGYGGSPFGWSGPGFLWWQ